MTRKVWEDISCSFIKIKQMETYSDKVEDTTRARKALEKMKHVEEKLNLHSQRINKSTIVFCKNKGRIKDYENYFKKSLL